ncbi:MAG: hypothetical protein JWO06_631, partial [Bacteroidota bacterium]|nr:hypothetical protein [Bacteroidota bacterium]
TTDNMVQFDDKEQNSIIVTGHLVMDKKKYLFGKAGFPATTDNNTLTFKLELNFKDNKFKYEIASIIYSYNRVGGPHVQGF